MTDEQKYSELLKEIGEIMAQKNIYISTQDFRIASLTRQLELAENQLEELRKEK